MVEEFPYAAPRADRPLKVTIPGPFTLSGRLTSAPAGYPDRVAVARAFVPILRAELPALDDAGAASSSSTSRRPRSIRRPQGVRRLFNAASAVQGRVRLAAHLCFGNFPGRPLARGLPAGAASRLPSGVADLVLEWANREMAELECLGEIAASGRSWAWGSGRQELYVESADDVAARIDPVLAAGVPAGRRCSCPTAASARRHAG